jgi:hypothetical protein
MRWRVECDGTESNIHPTDAEKWCQACDLERGHKTPAAAMACLIRYLREQASQYRVMIATRKAERARLLRAQRCESN